MPTHANIIQRSGLDLAAGDSGDGLCITGLQSCIRGIYQAKDQWVSTLRRCSKSVAPFT